MANRVFDTLAALDRARRRRARRGDPRDRRNARPSPALRAPRAAAVRHRRWRRRAASRCRPSTPSARGCCISFRSRPMWRRALPCSTKPPQAQLLDQTSLGVLLDAAADRRTAPLGRALATAIAVAADQTFKDVVGEAIRKRDVVTRLDRPRRQHRRARSRELCGTLGIAPDDTIDAASSRDRRRRRSAAVANGRAVARRLRARLEDRPGPVPRGSRAALAASGADARRCLSGGLLHRPSSSRARTSSPRRSRKQYPALAERLLARAGARAARCSSAARPSPAATAPRALLTIADAVIARYQRREGPARPARLRRPDRQGARRCSAASTPPGCITSSIAASTTC